MGINCIDHSTLTVTATAQTLSSACSPAMPSRAKGAVITVETDQIRWRADAAADADGHLLYVGAVLTFDSWSVPKANWRSVLLALSVIRVTANAALKISWYD